MHPNSKEPGQILVDPATVNDLELRYRKIDPPGKKELFILRFLILGGIILVFQFVFWYLDKDHVGQPLLFWLLNIAFGYKLLHLLYEWFYFASMQVPQKCPSTYPWTVDMLTTWMPGEPREMVIQTLKAMVSVKYPHTTYLCDEGNDPELKKACEEMGVVHVYRGPDKTGAKAGNINYALEHYATGEICVILDPDHVPVPEFLDRVLLYFEDRKIGFVQCIQAYYNQNESLIARGAAEQTYLFYGPLMMGMNRHGTVQAIGANCSFRREALDDIGGHATGLCEDMHTSMQLQARKWSSVYIPEMLSMGKTPSGLAAYYQQQFKWARGCFELLFEVYPKLVRQFTWKQRLHYFLTPLYFLYGLIGLIDIGIPVLSLFAFQVPLFIFFEEFIIRIVPVLVSFILIRYYAQRYVLDRHEMGLHTMGGILRVGTWWVYLMGLIYAVFRVKVAYVPTAKGEEVCNDLQASLPNLAVIAVSGVAIAYGVSHDWNPYTWLMAGFAAVNMVLLSIVTMAGQRKLLLRGYRYFRDGLLRSLRRQWSAIRYRYIYSLIQNNAFAILVSLLALGFSTLNLDNGMPREREGTNNLSGTRKYFEWQMMPSLKSRPTSMGEPCFTDFEHATNGNYKLQVFRLTGMNEKTPADFANALSYSQSASNIPLFSWFLQSGACPYENTFLNGQQEKVIDQMASLAAMYRQPIILSLESQLVHLNQHLYLQQLELFEAIHKRLKAGGASNISIAWKFVPGMVHDQFPAEGPDLIVLPLQEGKEKQMIRNFKEAGIFRPVLLAVHQPPASFLREQLKGEELTVIGWVHETVPVHASFVKSDRPHCSHLLQAGKVELKQEGHRVFADSTFFVKGIFYNPEHDWQDGHWPLTRRRLTEDFRKIRSMGANTISWYMHPVYDKNVLTVAGDQGLSVLYGLGFDPSIHYAVETEKVASLKKEILRKVRDHVDQPAIIGWVAGGDGWEQLSKHFSQPYLTEVRIAYIRFLDEISKEIKRIDPVRPVIACVNGGTDFTTALRELQYAPAIDIVGVNGYSVAQLGDLEKVSQWTDKPFLVTGFGPSAMWDSLYAFPGGKGPFPELTSFDKARFYSRIWNRYIGNDHLNSVGGVAYCWRDRYEGTATMSGIIDYKGRLKPAYFALKEIWTGEKQHFPLEDLVLFGRASLEKGKNILIVKAQSANNAKDHLNYEWYICLQGCVYRSDEITMWPGEMGNITYWLLSNFYEKIAGGMYPGDKGREIHIRNDGAASGQRIYLHISNDSGYVVTASYPIDPGHKIRHE